LHHESFIDSHKASPTLRLSDAAWASRFHFWLMSDASIAPLVTLRILFGAMMIASCARFLWLGWLDEQYVKPVFHFTYYGFSWVKPLPREWLYAVYFTMLGSAAGIMLGAFYRFSAIVFFLSFTYIELLDKAYYLNHYYFVSVMALLFTTVPAHRYFSVDAWRNPTLIKSHVPRWTIGIFQVQLAVVYGFAGLAKINADWLLNAMPLALWLPAHDDLPLIGALLRERWTAYLFSWGGMIYDCTIVLFLLWRKTRAAAYLSVIAFHLLTGILFQIGVFPLVMIATTPIFFSEDFHKKVLSALQRGLRIKPAVFIGEAWQPRFPKLLLVFFIVYGSLQLLMPLRFLVYPGHLFWTEEGYRFSWRVMLMEKSGDATFYVRDAATGREGMVNNRDFLNVTQEKQMAFQPDMILEFAHFLKRYYESSGMREVSVRAEVYVTLNGRPSRLFIDSTINLASEADGLHHQPWIVPFEK
jgi:hypothetical protein